MDFLQKNKITSYNKDANEFDNKQPLPSSNDDVNIYSNKNNESLNSNLPHNIKITNSYIEFTINNPNYGKESDLIKFYDKEYWDIVGLYPEVTIVIEGVKEEEQKKIGGENSIKAEEEEEEKKLTVPYRYIHYILRGNPIRSIFNYRASSTQPHPSSEPSRTLTILEKLGFKNKNESPYNYDNDPSPVPTLLTINPTVKKEVTTTLLPKSELFEMTPEKVLELETPSKNCLIKIKFTPNEGIESMAQIMTTRDMNIDIDVDEEGYKKKEKEKIERIMENKRIEKPLKEEIYKISEKIVIIKGLMQ